MIAWLQTRRNILVVASLLLLVIISILISGFLNTGNTQGVIIKSNLTKTAGEVSSAKTNLSRKLDLNNKSVLSGASSADQYLKIAGTNSKSLTTAYWMSDDQKYLEELKDLAGDSLPALSTLALGLGDINERSLFIDKLLGLDPGNKLNILLKINNLADLGDTESAINFLQKLSNLPKCDQYDTEKMLNIREAWQVLGADSITARTRSDNTTGVNTWFSTAVSSNIRKLWPAASKSLDEDSKNKLATSFLEAASAIRQSSKYATTHTEIIALGIERVILKSLPADFEFGETGNTLADQIAINEKNVKIGLELTSKAQNRLSVASSSLVELYYQRADAYGLKKAQEWLVAQP